ncbi:MAG: hypothetical protein R3335_05145 [Anaerolineales bacterium]|nr:hypothetical protein [Anaerolineales bacterium]
MYWLRTSPGLELVFWLLLTGLWALGGWLISTHAFRLRSRDRLISGLGTGLLLFIILSNLLANFLPLPAAFWLGAGSTALIGLLAARRSGRRPFLSKADFQAWPLLLALVGLTILFTLINRGLAIFDDYHNLPLVSMIAAGDVPPHYFLNPQTRLAFHYALHLFSAGMVRIGGFSVWAAFDISKAFSLSLAVALAYTWFVRVTRRESAGVWGSLLAILGGGSRWLLVLAPAGLLAAISQDLQFLGSAAQSGSELSSVLLSPWRIEGDGPVPFPFAFANGIFPPQVMALGASGALPTLTIFLLLVLSSRRWNYLSGTILGLILASLALSAEHVFVLVWAGTALAVMAGAYQERSLTRALPWIWILAISLLISVTAGGTLTEILRGQVESILGAPTGAEAAFLGFSLRWPPSLISAHLGSLSFARPGHMLVALAEIGAVLFLAPWATWWCWKRLRQGDWFTAGLGAAALMGFVIPMFVRYVETDRDIVRLASTSLLIWLVLGYPPAWFAAQRGPAWRRFAMRAGYAVIVSGGLALLTVQLAAIAQPRFTNFVDQPDALISRAYWDQLPPGVEVFDARPYRSVTLFGRSAGRAQANPYTAFPEWEALVEEANPSQIARAGYTFTYMDKRWWRRLSPEQREGFKDSCVIVLAEEPGPEGDFRQLLDVSGCD